MKMHKFTKTCLTAVSVALPFAADATQSGKNAYAEISSCYDGSVIGRATFKEEPSDEGIKTVIAQLSVWGGLDAGKHAVHIHETGSCDPCSAAGGHFDPGPASFTDPDANHPYHAGDLINIDVGENGIGTLWVPTTRVTLSAGPISLFDADGSAIIIHVDEDTYCPDGEEAGCAGGARAGCGIIYSGSGS